MKAELDFKLVPLDKWVDLYEAVGNDNGSNDTANVVASVWKDVKKAAEVQVKEEADYNKEIAEAIDGYLNGDTAWLMIAELTASRRKLLGRDVKVVSDDKQPKRENELAPVEDIIK